jgi:hypothetical protein
VETTSQGQALEFRARVRGTGRALSVASDGTVRIARGYTILRSHDWGLSWELDCRVPGPPAVRLTAVSRLARRLLRHYIAGLQCLPDGTRVAIARDGLYRAGPGETEMTQVFRVTRGSRPLNLSQDEHGRLLFGEYGSGLERTEVLVYASDDGGRQFHVVHQFPLGDIRHVHNVVCDADGGYWVLVGDFGPHPGIGYLSHDFSTFDWLARGSQMVRAVGAIVEPDALLYGTDSDREQNYIVRLEKRSGRLDKLRAVEGSSLFAARFGGVATLSTCVEPNPTSTSRHASLYGSTDLDSWNCLASFDKDIFHPVLFQFGTIVLPVSDGQHPNVLLSGQALNGIDDRIAVGRIGLRQPDVETADQTDVMDYEHARG